jgi:hypothetical protein
VISTIKRFSYSFFLSFIPLTSLPLLWLHCASRN